ncbi:UNKNOWN [Stylonychia lemnae]|uniref:Uncharacterized protein n=1 Tax=Stylonychia lemnae TaxID=5949 RepID=A0A078AZC7_STYLE|nr:UNKNOWN [Stylonychia lemnae]|eukprot:CDW86168.1 UNKNOWN [Stylonychia lemnae]
MRKANQALERKKICTLEILIAQQLKKLQEIQVLEFKTSMQQDFQIFESSRVKNNQIKKYWGQDMRDTRRRLNNESRQQRQKSDVQEQEKKRILRQSRTLYNNDSSVNISVKNAPIITHKNEFKSEVYLNLPESLTNNQKARNQSLDFKTSTLDVNTPYQNVSNSIINHLDYSNIISSETLEANSRSPGSLSAKKSEKKLFQLIDLKIERMKENEQKRKQIMDKLSRKLELSSIQRNQILIEDVQYRVSKKLSNKLEVIKKHNREMEEKQSQEFQNELQRLKEQQEQAKLFKKEQRLQEKFKTEQELKIKEIKQQEQIQQQKEDFENNKQRLEVIETKHIKSQQKMFESLKQKSDNLKHKNRLLSEKRFIVQEMNMEKERKIAESFLKNEQYRSTIYHSRQLRQSNHFTQQNGQIYQMNNDPLDVEKRNKYSILNRSVNSESRANFDLNLHQSLEERIRKATERKEEQEKERQRQNQLKKEMERLKLEEIQELKRIQQNQRQAINKHIFEKQKEKELQVRQMRESLEKRAQEAYNVQIRYNKEKELKIRQSLNFI